MKSTLGVIVCCFLALSLPLAKAQSEPSTLTINRDLYRVSCDADWNSDCKGDQRYEVPTSFFNFPAIRCIPDVQRNCPPSGYMPSEPTWDLCKFTMREDHAGHGSWAVTLATPRYIDIHVESVGSHNPLDRWGGDVMVTLASMTLIDQNATDEERLAKGCTTPAGQCICINDTTHNTFGIKDQCQMTDCVTECRKFNAPAYNVSFYKFLAGKGAAGMCPLK